MAVNATFRADFSSFVEAVQKAEASLSGFNGDVNTVEKSLGRMMDQFSGQKLANDAALMTRAIGELGGATTLTVKQMREVNDVVGEAVAKYHALGEEAPADMKALADETGRLLAESKKLGDAQHTVQDSSTTGYFKDLSSEIGRTAAGFLSAQAVIGGVSTAIRTLTDFLGASVQSFASAEAAQNKMVVALHQQHTATPEVIAQYNALATQFQATTAFSDDLVNEMEALLTQVGDVMPAKMGTALQASTDLAAGLGIDLQSATMLVAKAAAGHTESLGRYGIAVSEADLKTRGFDAVLEGINRQFGGQAQAQLDTYAGRVTALENAWDNFREAIGEQLVMNPLVKRALESLKDSTNDLGDAAAKAKPSLAGFIQTWTGVDTAPLAVFEDYIDALNRTDDALKNLEQHAPKAPFGTPDALKPISEGLKIFDADVKQHTQDVKEAEAAQKAWTEATKELATIGSSWQSTLDTINGDVVAAIQFYLDAGVSQKTLADAYGLTAAQVRSVAAAMKEEADARKAAQDIEKGGFTASLEGIGKKATAELDYVNQSIAGSKLIADVAKQNADYILKQTLDETDYKVTKIREWEEATKKAFGGTRDQADAYYALVHERAEQQVSEVLAHSKTMGDAYAQMYKQATDGVLVIGQTAADVEAARTAGAKQTGDQVTEEYRRQQEAFMSFKGVVVAGTGEMVAANESLNRLMTTAITNYGDLLERDFQLEQAQRDRGEFFIPGMSRSRPFAPRAAGGPVAAGGSYLVGEKGPELFRPAVSGQIIPNAAGVTVNNVVYVNGSVRDIAPQLVQELTRLMKQTRQWPTA